MQVVPDCRTGRLLASPDGGLGEPSQGVGDVSDLVAGELCVDVLVDDGESRDDVQQRRCPAVGEDQSPGPAIARAHRAVDEITRDQASHEGGDGRLALVQRPGEPSLRDSRLFLDHGQCCRLRRGDPRRFEAAPVGNSAKPRGGDLQVEVQTVIACSRHDWSLLNMLSIVAGWSSTCGPNSPPGRS
jgi:hypothetical protein